MDLRQIRVRSERGRDVRGEAEFNEVTFDNVKLPHDALLGGRGDGWKQVTAELALDLRDVFVTPVDIADVCSTTTIVTRS